MRIFNRLSVIASIAVLSCLAIACEEDEPKLNFNPTLGAENVVDTIVSESKPWSGQKERSSENFSTKGLGKGSHILWSCPEGISFDVKIDKTAATDPVYASGLKNGSITPYKAEDKMYIANPKNASSKFTVRFTVFTPTDGGVYVWSAKEHMAGQSHRSSTNFKFDSPYSLYRVSCPEGVSFNINRDISGGSDASLYTGLKNDTLIHRTWYENIYIADPNGATGDFAISFIPEHCAWMGLLPDKTPIVSLSIPGTHDSGTKLAGGALSNCQHFTIEEQLYAGIRYLDVRLGEDLRLFHGSDHLEINFNDVLNWTNAYLERYSTETVLMRIKQERGEIGDSISKYFQKQKTQVARFKLDSVLGTLGESRGKIIMLRDFPKPSDGRKWGVYLTDGWPSDDSASYVNIDGQALYVQDRYYSASEATHDTKEKIKLVKATINDADSAGFPNHLFLNHASVAGRLVTNPYDYAWGGSTCDNPVMPPLSDYLQKFEDPMKISRTGVLILDFYSRNGNDDTHWLPERIVNLNFDSINHPYPVPYHKILKK